MNINVFEELVWRGLVQNVTPKLADVLSTDKLTAYIGFDPSAPSLHVGSLLPAMALARLQRFGHSPIAIVGGGTGLIGDPSGKRSERPLLTSEQIEQNLRGIRSQLACLLDFEAKKNPARIVNNADWLVTLNLIEFLREVGKIFTVNELIRMESVKQRLSNEVGISVAEFVYGLLQAYDFLVLYDRYKCTLQMGGSDQWGNITLGIELIRKIRGVRVHGLVFPLVTKADGTKFGKTESGNIWLDASLTSPHEFYQFWLNTDDRDVIHYLKYFTWLSETDIASVTEAQEKAPERREAQNLLAREVTRMIHGQEAADRSERVARVLFGDSVVDLSADDISQMLQSVPIGQVARSAVEGDGMDLPDFLVKGGVASSKNEARRLIEGGGLYLSGTRITDVRHKVTLTSSIGGRFFLIRKGRKHYHIVEVR